MKGTEYVVVDLETTGLSKYKHKITEIAAQKIINGKVIDEFQTLINPEIHIPSFITRLTGIDDELVKDSPTVDKVMPEFINFVGGATIVAHNASFDMGFLTHNAMVLGLKLENNSVCTRRLANRILPDLSSKKLSCLCNHFGFVNEQAHRAMADVKVTSLVFHEFQKMLENKSITKHDELLKFQKLPGHKNPFINDCY